RLVQPRRLAIQWRGSAAALAARSPPARRPRPAALLAAALLPLLGAAGPPRPDGPCAAAHGGPGECSSGAWVLPEPLEDDELDEEMDALRTELLQAAASRSRKKNTLGGNERFADDGPLDPFDDHGHHHHHDMPPHPAPRPTSPQEVQGKIICVQNGGLFDLYWTMTDTISGQMSNSSRKYHKGGNNCLTISEELPGCANGDPIAITVKAVGGAEKIFQHVSYDSQATEVVVITCKGSAQDYDCKPTEGTPDSNIDGKFGGGRTPTLGDDRESR
ncbi:unnamed protein product, partial [Prorocentrum cordatum]